MMVLGYVHQMAGSTEVDMYKMSAIGHFFLILFFKIKQRERATT